METWQGKHFSITDPKGVNTVIYQINETEKQYLKDSPKYTVDRLDFTEEIRGEMTRKTFYVNNPSAHEDQLIILSFGQEKVVVNMALLKDDKITMSKKPIPLKLDNIYSEQSQEIKEVKYTPNLKRPICIIDPETTEEVKPVLYFDEETNEIKGKCKLKPYKSYFAFEIKDKEDEGGINNE